MLTGKILFLLYPEDRVRIEGYEKMEGRYSQHLDVIASNISFVDAAIFYPLLSNQEIPAVKQSTQATPNHSQHQTVAKKVKLMLDDLDKLNDLNPFLQELEDSWFPDEKKEWDEKKATITNTQAGEFRGTLFDMEDSSIKKESTPSVRHQSVIQEPLMTLYDLFAFTQGM